MVGITFVVLVAAGCKSRTLGPYVSPRVIGQVLAADTRQPLAGVRVVRGSSRKNAAAGSSLKGGELLMLRGPVQTDRQGRFVLASERVLSIVRGANWNVVSLSFDRAGYEHFQTNCSTSLAIGTAEGEPLLDIGPVLLRPAPRTGNTESGISE